MRTIFSLAEKGYAPYFDIRKNKDEYVFLILLPRTGAVRPICETLKGKTLWKRVQRAIKEKTK